MYKRKQPPTILAVGGSDSSGGAGIQADIKSISATGGYAASAVTALTAQNTCGVRSIEAVTQQFISEQLAAVSEDFTVAAVKVGMLHRPDVIDVVVLNLLKYQWPYVVVDPVMVATSGDALLTPDTIDSLHRDLLPQASLMTPNLKEAEVLLSREIKTQADMSEAVKALAHAFSVNVLLKGGHLSGSVCADHLYEFIPQRLTVIEQPHCATRHTHGTGCTLSAAIASYLGQGFSLIDSVRQGNAYTYRAIVAATHHHQGQGSGPVDHFYFIQPGDVGI